jgi:hypothetical protein
VTSISIWDLAVSGWSLIHSGWNVFMDGKEAILIGEATPFAMIISEEMPVDMKSKSVAVGQVGQVAVIRVFNQVVMFSKAVACRSRMAGQISPTNKRNVRSSQMSGLDSPTHNSRSRQKVSRSKNSKTRKRLTKTKKISERAAIII